MGIVELLSLAASVSLLSGWRLYLTVFATGVAMRTGWIALPDHLEFLTALANPWVIGIAALGAIAEFLADKVAFVDSVWDAVHSVVRPLGGALLAMAVVDTGDPAWQIVAFLAGGGAAFAGHAAKATTRAAVNVSPEPFSNVAVSTGEDIAAGGLLLLMFANPVAAAIIALLLLGLTIWALVALRRWLRRVLGRKQGATIRPPPV
ncbi:DUF4126 domain-containing protein [Novosphingopyxis sp.]|uniref:DUF4126 domain-containing protein n=1 Tax=Novosphingopyxis sp. TaxID=2709690 RepID=UPI003B593BE8